MRKKGSHIFLWIPLFLLMLHSITPHHHVSVRESLSLSQSHECPSNLLSDIFQFDLGNNHLEEFEILKTQPDVSVDLIQVAEIIMDFEEVGDDVEKPNHTEVSLPVNQQYLVGSHTLRAPPAIIV